MNFISEFRSAGQNNHVSPFQQAEILATFTSLKLSRTNTIYQISKYTKNQEYSLDRHGTLQGFQKNISVDSSLWILLLCGGFKGAAFCRPVNCNRCVYQMAASFWAHLIDIGAVRLHRSCLWLASRFTCAKLAHDHVLTPSNINNVRWLVRFDHTKWRSSHGFHLGSHYIAAALFEVRSIKWNVGAKPSEWLWRPCSGGEALTVLVKPQQCLKLWSDWTTDEISLISHDLQPSVS